MAQGKQVGTPKITKATKKLEAKKANKRTTVKK